jgi:hypothetical protein
VPNSNIGTTPEAADEIKFLETLRGHDRGVANNFRLMQLLGWDAARYWPVRNRLKDSGRVQIRRGGPGGATFIPPASTAVPEASVAGGPEADAPPRTENDLYDPMLGVLEKSWVKDEEYDSYIVRKTAWGGRRDIGGRWTRPDLCIVAIRKFKFLRDPVFDVISFEVKPEWSISVQGVFEALSHKQSSTRAYVIYHVSDKDFDELPEADRITALAEQHGIGVILAGTPCKFETWTEKVRARRSPPDPEYLNEFLQLVFPESDHGEIIKLAR